jgi:anti-sigma regulatory factor (Ser/Thr protein kinase)
VKAPLHKNAPVPARHEQRLTSDPANIAPARRAVEAFATRLGFSETAVADIGLCINEALANVIRHAYGGKTDQPVLVVAEQIDDPVDSPARALRVTIRDWGSGVNPAALPPRQHDPLQPGGLGLICLRRLMDHVEFVPQPDGMLLTMLKHQAAGAGL